MTSVAGRILFGGTAELRKGIHYYAEAANKLQALGRPYSFRVAVVFRTRFGTVLNAAT